MQSTPISRWQTISTWLFGFLLPAGTLLFESWAHFCADHLFDPLPSFLHQVVVAWVPFGCLLVLNIHSPSHPQHRHLPWILGSMLSICLIYTLPFLPLLAIALMAVLYFGIGLLPLAPLLAGLVSLRWLVWLKKQGTIEHFGRRVVLGMLLGVVLFGIADGRRWLTHWSAEMAVADDSETRLRGLQILRRFGDDTLLLKLGQQFGSEVMLYSPDISPEDARRLYFQVTGRALASGGFENDGFERWQETLIPGKTTWRLQPHLTLTTSHLHATLDPSAPMAYMQWGMVFSNGSSMPIEALAEIALPEGARVSRATLWIADEPREAAFGGKAQVTAAYEDVVVVRRKDPLLVTTAGPDRVRIRAFPIPAQGTLRLQLGITAPLDVVRAVEGRLDLPYFSEKNFVLGPESYHQIQLENVGRALRLHAPKGLANPFQMTDEQLAHFETFVAIHRDDSHTTFWRGDDPEAPDLVARLVQGQKPRPRHVVVVLDGSVDVGRHRQELEQVLVRLATVWPDLVVVLAADSPRRWSGGKADDAGAAVRQWLAEQSFTGGQDNTPGLLEGIALAKARPGGAVLWIGGAQPVELTATETVQVTLESLQPLPALFVLPLEPGPQRLWDAFEVPSRDVLPRYDTLLEDLAAFPGVDSQRRFFELRFEPPGTPRPAGAQPASSHLTRLWAADQVQHLLRQADDERTQDALRLAVEHQLVTPVSGAVVLETAEQYADHDLQPVAPGSVPTIPEPEVWALLLIALGTFAWMAHRRRLG